MTVMTVRAPNLMRSTVKDSLHTEYGAWYERGRVCEDDLGESQRRSLEQPSSQPDSAADEEGPFGRCAAAAAAAADAAAASSALMLCSSMLLWTRCHALRASWLSCKTLSEATAEDTSAL